MSRIQGWSAGRGALESGRHHGEAAHDLAALEQQIAKRRLRAGMALLGGELEPARGLAGTLALTPPSPANSILPQLELGVRVAVVGGGAL